MKRIVECMLVLIFLGLTVYQFNCDYKIRRQPPSEKWSKEVLLTKANINFNTQIIKYKTSYLVAFDDGENIRILQVDSLGKVIRENSFASGVKEPRQVNVLSDGENIYLNWIASQDRISDFINLKLDEKLNIIERNSINNIADKSQIDEYVLLIVFEDKITFMDFKNGKSSNTMVNGPSLVAGTKVNDKYMVVFRDDFGDVLFYNVKNNETTEPALLDGFYYSPFTEYYSSQCTTDGKYGYYLIEYKEKNKLTEYLAFVFKLDGSPGQWMEVKVEGLRFGITNVVPLPSSEKDGICFICSADREYSKKEIYGDIVEVALNAEGKDKMVPATRTKALSGYPSACGDTIVFTDFGKEGENSIFMASSREEFKKVNNNNRPSEVAMALVFTFQSIAIAVAYLFVHGVLWLIPSLCGACFLCILEYKFSSRGKKLAFILAYIFAIAIKLISVNYVYFKKYKSSMPDNITPQVGLWVSLIIGILCMIYGYIKYSEDTEKNIIALSLSHAAIIDAILTQAFLVPYVI